MKKNNNTCKILIQVTLAFIFIAFSVSFLSSVRVFTVYARQETNKYDDEILQYYQEPGLEQDFEDDGLFVILKNRYSQEVTIGFSDFDIESKDKIYSISNFIDTIYRDEQRVLVLEERHNQILEFKLYEHSKETVIDLIKELNTLEIVLVAEPMYIYQVEECWSPSDTYYPGQWGLNGVNGIQAEFAWDIQTGQTNLDIGIMENGAALTHEDLSYKISNGNLPVVDTGDDHGTHVSGIVGAKKNNIGISGVTSSNLVLLNRKSGSLPSSLTYAKENNIKIVNASFRYTIGGEVAGPNCADFAAIRDYDGLFVAAAGNRDVNIDTDPQYPAAYNLPNLIAIGAIDNYNARCSFSNYSSSNTTVQIYAPGKDILSTFPISQCTDYDTVTTDRGIRLKCECEYEYDTSASTWKWVQYSTHLSNGYHYMSGTSMAAPHVAGVAALMLSVNPNLTGAELKTLILDNADDISISIPGSSGGTTTQNVKKLNAYKSVAAALLNVDPISGQITGLKSGTSFSGTLSIPDELNGTTVTGIADNAFYNKPAITNVILPNTITSIGAYAFGNCTNLTNINIPSSVTSIGGGAFYNCSSLTSVNIPAGVTSIGSSTFSGCSSLTSLSIPTSVTSIGMFAFSGCLSLTSINIPSGVTNIGLGAFMGCSGLTSISLPSGITSVSYNLLQDCTSLTSVYLPSGVTVIGTAAFINCTSLASITIPSGVTAIYGNAFNGCTSMTSINIPASVTSISPTAFSGCSGLTSLTVDSNNPVYKSEGNCIIRRSDNALIVGCGSSIIPSYVTAIGSDAFNGRLGLTSIVLPSSVTSIGANAFSGCIGLSKVILKNTGTNFVFGNNAFYNTSPFLRIYVPYGSYSRYADASGVNAYIPRIWEYVYENGNYYELIGADGVTGDEIGTWATMYNADGGTIEEGFSEGYFLDDQLYIDFYIDYYYAYCEIDQSEYAGVIFEMLIELDSTCDGMEVILLDGDLQYVETYEVEDGMLFISLYGVIDENNDEFRLYPGDEDVEITFLPEDVYFNVIYKSLITL